MKSELIKTIFVSLVSSFSTIIVASWKASGWKMSVDKDITENKKDIQNLKNADKSFVSKEDFKDIKESLKSINEKLFTIAKNMPTIYLKDKK